jgi:hypothetical protein
MATKKLYKVWLTVKDSYGNIKELDGGTIGVDLNQEVLDQIESVLPLDEYLKKSETDYLATDAEVQEEVNSVSSLKYSDFSSK